MTEEQTKGAVRQRDGNRCIRCGMTADEHLAKYGIDLDVHRVIPGSDYSLAPGACQTLCRACHAKQKRRPSHWPLHPIQTRGLLVDLRESLYLALKAEAAANRRTVKAQLEVILETYFAANPQAQ